MMKSQPKCCSLTAKCKAAQLTLAVTVLQGIQRLAKKSCIQREGGLLLATTLAWAHHVTWCCAIYNYGQTCMMAEDESRHSIRLTPEKDCDLSPCNHAGLKMRTLQALHPTANS